MITIVPKSDKEFEVKVDIDKREVENTDSLSQEAVLPLPDGTTVKIKVNIK